MVYFPVFFYFPLHVFINLFCLFIHFCLFICLFFCFAHAFLYQFFSSTFPLFFIVYFIVCKVSLLKEKDRRVLSLSSSRMTLTVHINLIPLCIYLFVCLHFENRYYRICTKVEEEAESRLYIYSAVLMSRLHTDDKSVGRQTDRRERK